MYFKQAHCLKISHNFPIYYSILYMGNIRWQKILANHTGNSYWQGKIWQISYSHCICQLNTFSVYLWILMSKILAWFTKFANFFPAKYFPCTVLKYYLYYKLLMIGKHGADLNIKHVIIKQYCSWFTTILLNACSYCHTYRTHYIWNFSQYSGGMFLHDITWSIAKPDFALILIMPNISKACHDIYCTSRTAVCFINIFKQGVCTEYRLFDILPTVCTYIMNCHALLLIIISCAWTIKKVYLLCLLFTLFVFL